MANAKEYVWRDPSGITRGAIAVLTADFAVRGLKVPLVVVYGRLADYGSATPSGLLQWLHWALDVLELPILVAGIVLMFWILRISRNAHTFSSRMETGPWWAALWWYVIPIASIFKPYVAMGEIWDVSAPNRTVGAKAHAFIAAWWIASILAGVSGNFVALSHKDPAVVTIFYCASMAQCVTLIMIARRIRDMQREKHIANAFSDEGQDRPLSVLERLNG